MGPAGAVLDVQGGHVLALQLTSEDHDLDAEEEARAGVRREGAALDRALFEAVVEATGAHLTF